MSDCSSSHAELQQLPAGTAYGKQQATRPLYAKLHKPVQRSLLLAQTAACHVSDLQYLPSALRDTGKRQLDCLGIATTVLGMCHQIAAQWPAQHWDLADTVMCVSDDHCWLGVPATQQPQVATADTSHREQQQQLVFVEVTDPG